MPWKEDVAQRARELAPLLLWDLRELADTCGPGCELGPDHDLYTVGGMPVEAHGSIHRGYAARRLTIDLLAPSSWYAAEGSDAPSSWQALLRVIDRYDERIGWLKAKMIRNNRTLALERTPRIDEIFEAGGLVPLADRLERLARSHERGDA